MSAESSELKRASLGRATDYRLSAAWHAIWTWIFLLSRADMPKLSGKDMSRVSWDAVHSCEPQSRARKALIQDAHKRAIPQ